MACIDYAASFRFCRLLCSCHLVRALGTATTGCSAVPLSRVAQVDVVKVRGASTSGQIESLTSQERFDVGRHQDERVRVTGDALHVVVTLASTAHKALRNDRVRGHPLPPI